MKKIIPELYSTGEKLIYYREKAPSLKSFDLIGNKSKFKPFKYSNKFLPIKPDDPVINTL